MKQRTTTYWGLILSLLLCLLTGSHLPAQSDFPRTNPDPFPNLTLGFVTPALSPEQLQAFEGRAIQKSRDYFDLLKLVTDPDIDASMREQATEMAIGLFWPEDGIVRGWGRMLLPDTIITIRMKINMLQADRGANYGEMKQVSIAQPLQRTDEDSYQGELKWEMLEKGKSRQHYVRFWVIRREKVFGLTTRTIWEVLLGEIR